MIGSPSKAAIEVYRLEIRLYQINDEVKTYAEFYQEVGKASDLLASAHEDTRPLLAEFGFSHDTILSAAVSVIPRISESLTDPLF